MRARVDYDDSQWRRLDSRLPVEEYKKIGWQGIAWFRIHIKVDSSLWDTPLSLMIRQAGASEVYLNGKLLYKFGKVGTTKNSEKTATEVGGDYYDFNISKDGTLNVVIGDATGHGMKAGNMVVSIKSLIYSLPDDMLIPDFFNRCTRIIKHMNMKNLYMCLSLIRI